MDLELKNKVAIVTGGAGGLGAAISRVLAAEGTHIAVYDIADTARTAPFTQEIAAQYGVDALPIRGDITSGADIDLAIETCLDRFGRLDILVNNAGVWPTAYVRDMEDDDWERTVRINLTGPYLFSKRMVRRLLDSGQRGKIVNIVSQAAFHGSTSGHAHYAAAKGGLVTFTVSLAREVAPFGINVNAVAPGMMRTPMNVRELGEREGEYLKRIPLGRIADPAEVAYAVAFLCSARADYITGATLDVTGGMLMR